MAHDSTRRIEAIGSYLLVILMAELNSLDKPPKNEKPKPEGHKVQPIPFVYPTYDSQCRLPLYNERPQIDYLA